jgi:exportin-2 (importin alpha re-exporter)
VSSLTPSDFNTNAAVLETAHSIFRPWRAQTRSDALYSTINLVVTKFLPPYAQLFPFTIARLFADPPPPPAELAHVAQSMALLVELFYDLTCHDLPPQLEDGHEEFFDREKGHFMRLMAWDPEALRTDVRRVLLLTSILLMAHTAR